MILTNTVLKFDIYIVATSIVSKSSKQIYYSAPIVYTILLLLLIPIKYFGEMYKKLLSSIAMLLFIFYVIAFTFSDKTSNGFDYCCKNTTDSTSSSNFTIASDCLFIKNDIYSCNDNRIYMEDYDLLKWFSLLLVFFILDFTAFYCILLMLNKHYEILGELKMNETERNNNPNKKFKPKPKTIRLYYHICISILFIGIFLSIGGEIYLFHLHRTIGYNVVATSVLIFDLVYTIMCFIIALFYTFYKKWIYLNGLDVVLYFLLFIDIIGISFYETSNYSDTYNKCCLKEQLSVDDKCSFLSKDICNSYYKVRETCENAFVSEEIIIFVGFVLIGAGFVYIIFIIFILVILIYLFQNVKKS